MGEEQSLNDPMPPRILSLIRASSAWGELCEGWRLRLGLPGSWHPLQQSRDLAPEAGGVYAIAVDRPLQYPDGPSAVVYVGSAKRLKRRLSTHIHRSHNEMIRRVQASSAYSLVATWASVPGLPVPWLVSLEAAFIGAFAARFGTCPAFNYGPPDSCYDSFCRDAVEIAQPESHVPPVPMPQFAEELGMDCTVWTAGPGPVVTAIDKVTGLMRFGEPTIEFRRHPSPPPAPAPAPDPRASADLPIASRYVPDIYIEHIAEWPATKVAELIQVAKSLTIAAPLQCSAIYEAATTSLPASSTWGEVALVVARTLAHRWFTKKAIEVTIRHSDQLLGHACIGRRDVYGFDLLKTPGSVANRPSFWTRWEAQRAKPIRKETVETHRDEGGIEFTTATIEDIQARPAPREDNAAAVAAMNGEIERVFQEAQRIIAEATER